MTALNSRSSEVRSPGAEEPSPGFSLSFQRELHQQSTSGHGHGHYRSPLCMMKPGMCCPQASPERVEGPAAGRRREMVSTGTARSGSRCPPLFLLLLILSSSCHMLHGQGKRFTARGPGFKCQMMHYMVFTMTLRSIQTVFKGIVEISNV